MKVVEGTFGQEKDSRSPGETPAEQLEKSGFNELKEGEYLLLADMGDAMLMLSNFTLPEQVLMQLEKGRIAIMTTQFEPTGGAA
jgi:hypothetical protein